MRFAKVNLIKLNLMLLKPSQGRQSLARQYETDIAGAGLHVPGCVDDDFVARSPERLNLLDRTSNRLEVCIRLSIATEFTNHAIKIDANPHRAPRPKSPRVTNSVP